MASNRNTLCDLIVTTGERCEKFVKARMKGVEARNLQIDEVWSFVNCKAGYAEHKQYGPEVGDAYSYVAIERDSKLIVCHRLGKRDDYDTREFIHELSQTVTGKFHISTDGWRPYQSCIPVAFNRQRVSYGQIVKTYKTPERVEQRRYSPPRIVTTTKHAIMGVEAAERTCTSHIERSNLTLRMTLRRCGVQSGA